jgi:hypothetical protein
MTGIQRVMNRCMFFLQLEERAKADRDPAKAKHAREQYRANKQQLNTMRVRRNKLNYLHKQHDLHKQQGVSEDEFFELVNLIMEPVDVEQMRSAKVESVKHWNNLCKFRLSGEVDPTHDVWLNQEIAGLEQDIVRPSFVRGELNG